MQTKPPVAQRALRTLLAAVFLAVATAAVAQTPTVTPATDLCVQSGACKPGGLGTRALEGLERTLSPDPAKPPPPRAGLPTAAPARPPVDPSMNQVLLDRERQDQAARRAQYDGQAGKSAGARQADYDRCRATQAAGANCAALLTHEENTRAFVSEARSNNLQHVRFDLAQLKQDDERLARKLRDACGGGAQASRECRYAQDEIESLQSRLRVFLAVPETRDAQKLDPSLTYSLRSEGVVAELNGAPPADDLLVRRGGDTGVAGLRAGAIQSAGYEAQRTAREAADEARQKGYAQAARERMAREAAAAQPGYGAGATSGQSAAPVVRDACTFGPTYRAAECACIMGTSGCYRGRR